MYACSLKSKQASEKANQKSIHLTYEFVRLPRYLEVHPNDATQSWSDVLSGRLIERETRREKTSPSVSTVTRYYTNLYNHPNSANSGGFPCKRVRDAERIRLRFRCLAKARLPSLRDFVTRLSPPLNDVQRAPDSHIHSTSLCCYQVYAQEITDRLFKMQAATDQMR
jgi:hypothetical protein